MDVDGGPGPRPHTGLREEPCEFWLQNYSRKRPPKVPEPGGQSGISGGLFTLQGASRTDPDPHEPGTVVFPFLGVWAFHSKTTRRDDVAPGLCGSVTEGVLHGHPAPRPTANTSGNLFSWGETVASLVSLAPPIPLWDPLCERSRDLRQAKPSRLQAWSSPSPQKMAGPSAEPLGPPEPPELRPSRTLFSEECVFTVLGHSGPDSGFRAQEEGEQPREAEVRRPYWSLGSARRGEAWGLRVCGVSGAHHAGLMEHLCPLQPRPPPQAPGSCRVWGVAVLPVHGVQRILLFACTGLQLLPVQPPPSPPPSTVMQTLC